MFSPDSPESDFRLSSDEPDFTVPGQRIDLDSAPSVIKLESRGITSHRPEVAPKAKQEEFWEKQRHWKDAIAAKLRSESETLRTMAAQCDNSADEARLQELSRQAWEVAQGLDLCHSIRSHATCMGCKASVPFYNRCDCGHCPCCAPRRARERRDSLEFWVKQVAQPKHVVLTLRNVPTLTKEYVQQAKKWFAAFRRRKFAENWVGGFYSLEVTNEGRGWHLHFHVVVDAAWVDASQLAIEWNKANHGNGHIVKVKDCREKSYLQEVTKYAVKGSDLAAWTPSNILSFILAFQGVRQFGVFGALMGKRAEFRLFLESLEQVLCCEKCGCENIRCFDDNEMEAFQAGIPPGPRKRYGHH